MNVMGSVTTPPLSAENVIQTPKKKKKSLTAASQIMAHFVWKTSAPLTVQFGELFK